LKALRPRGLVRSSRLKRDLEYLLGVHPTDLEVLLAKYPGDKVANFCTHIRKSVNEKPWTLVSYAWCFYMAVFSGGRWIRSVLLKAPPGFWPEQDGEEKSLAECGLSFWHFFGPHDGEDIKADFKTQLLAAEALFTPDERVDIIEEAKNIFRLCATLVDELDESIGTDMSRLDTTPLVHPEPKVASTKEPLIISNVSVIEHVTKTGDPFKTFLRRPEVTGTLVAIGCLVVVTLFKLQ
jgi:heme oxygenase